MIIVLRGVESIKWFESLAAPALIVVGIALFIWAINIGGGLTSVLKNSKLFLQPTITAKMKGDTISVRLDPLREESGVCRVERMKVVILSGEKGQSEVSAALAEKDWQSFKPNLKLDWPGEEKSVTVGAELGSIRYQDAYSIVCATAKREEGRPAGPWLFIAFCPALTAMVGYWATLSLNIPDFTRYAKSQKDQILGQAIGLPTTMTLYAFVGVVATCAALIAFPDILAQEDAPWDPVALLSHFQIPWMVVLSMTVLAVATLTTNIAANVVAPANGFSNIAPHKISFRMGGLITGVIGIVMMPWKLLATAGKFIFTWLIGYSALMGGVAGVMIADYYVVRRRKLDLAGLYKEDGPYRYTGGFNWVGIISFILGVLPNIPGFLAEVAPQTFAQVVPQFFKTFYLYAWFTGFFISFIVYAVWMSAKLKRAR